MPAFTPDLPVCPAPRGDRTCLHPTSLRLSGIGLALSALLSACGGGGGGGASSTTPAGAGTTAASGSVTSGDFPLGVALATPSDLGNAADLVAGGLGIVDPGVSVLKVPLQGIWSSQADAIATNRLNVSGSGLYDVNALFNTTLPSDASCYGPAVSYINHDDSQTSGTLPAGHVAMWADTDGGTPAQACSASQLSARTGTEAAQIQQAMLLMAAVRQVMAANPSLMPTTSTPLDLTAAVSALLAPVLSGVTVNTATATVATDATTGNPIYGYRIVLTRGSGNGAQNLEVAVTHTPTETNLRYLGTLQITVGYLSTDPGIGCTDQVAGGLYKASRLTSLAYNRQYDLLSTRARSAQYCGMANLTSTSFMADLASLTPYGELDQTVALSTNVRGSVLGWRSHFSSWPSSISMSPLDQDFRYIWQDVPDGSVGSHARLMAGTLALNTSTATRTTLYFHGYTDDITDTAGNLLGMVCNDRGPGSTNTMLDLFQYQHTNLGASASNWALDTSNIAYAPTNNCNASSTMTYSSSAGLVSNTTNALLGLSASGVTTVDGEIAARGYTAPEFNP